MKRFKPRFNFALSIIAMASLLLASCQKQIEQSQEETVQAEETNRLEGTWKMYYADIQENDSVQVKDLTSTDFIKIINKSHFAFFNQERDSDENYTAGAGTYTFDGSTYVENLDFINYADYRGHSFSFEVEINGDTLIQQGHEKIEASGIDRYIVEKYVRISN